MVHRRCSRQLHHADAVSIVRLSVNTCQLVYCLSINKVSVGLLFVSLKQTYCSHLCKMTLSSLSNFITTSLGHMKAWATCNSLDWVTCFPLHFTLAYIVYIWRTTDRSSYLHTCTLWRPR